jgi:23S rRNA pseudouridine2605 synthase
VKVRLQKLLAEAGLGSRRGCEDLITAGRVTVNGERATLGVTAEPGADTVALDGHPIVLQAKEYWLLNKPAGVLSAVVDARGRPTVTDYVPTGARVFPVGRLDLESTGLLLLTNDGELTDRLLHPRYHVEKEYIVKVRGGVDETSLRKLREGITLEEGTTAPAEVSVIQAASGSNRFTSTLKVIIREGRKRQIRRMLETVGHRVVALHRTRFATLTDRGLTLGEARRLSAQEVAVLRRLAGLA